MIISKILSKIGLPVLLKFVRSTLLGIESETAQKAASFLFDVDKDIEAQKITSGDLKEANRHLESMSHIESEIDAKTLNTINDTIRQELKSEDKFVRFWRPTFGYCVSLAWLCVMFTVCYVIVSGKENADKIIMALVETTSLWGVALGVLGISVIKRSQEKQQTKERKKTWEEY